MSVTENRNPVGLEVQNTPRARDDALSGLPRQAVNEIEIERPDPELARGERAGLCLFVGLLAADRSLHGGLEILHAETDASDAHWSESVAAIGWKRRWVDLDRDLSVGRQEKPLPELFHNRQQAVTRQQGRRAAAPVHVRHGSPGTDQPSDMVNLSRQQLCIGSSR